MVFCLAVNEILTAENKWQVVRETSSYVRLRICCSLIIFLIEYRLREYAPFYTGILTWLDKVKEIDPLVYREHAYCRNNPIK